LWIAHTYMVNVFSISPLLIINAPERACAKTLFQTVISDMSFKPLSASNVTPSSLFRSIELWQPTMFFDEADTFFKENNDLKGMVNAGNSKKNGFVLRSEAVGDTYEPRKFSVYGAKSIAGIALEKHLPDATLSRGIIFKMRRKLPEESVTRLRDVDPKLFRIISSKLMRVAIDYCDEINASRPHLPKELSDRAQDNWEPLLAIASCASEEWLERATSAALKLSNASNESMSTGNELLADIQHVFEDKGPEGQYLEKISTVDLIEQLSHIHDGPWKTYNNGHPISPRQLSKQLSYYDIKPKTVRIANFNTPKGYSHDQFTDAFARYLSPSKPEDIDEPVDDAPESNSNSDDPDF
jgi:putative DNA primase/helicase